jgi:2,5-diketo-D-gluconate reductase B
VLGAIDLGYRHIDTAQMYGNEDAVGAAMSATSVPRADIHLTTKVWWENLAPSAMRRAIETSLRQLRTNYVDLYLIH